MNLKSLHETVRSHVRDFNDTILRKSDITLFINEAIDRVIQVLPQLENIPYLENDEDVVELIPREYIHLLASYATARLMAQDERHYEAGTFMNEFEHKLVDLKEKVDNGEVVIIDPDTGEPLLPEYNTEYVANTYFSRRRVEGV